jgi:hypothetical protein
VGVYWLNLGISYVPLGIMTLCRLSEISTPITGHRVALMPSRRIQMCIEVSSFVLMDCSDDEIVYKVVRKVPAVYAAQETYCSLYPPNQRVSQLDISKLGIIVNDKEPYGCLIDYSIGVKVKAKENTPLFYCFDSFYVAHNYCDTNSVKGDLYILTCTAEGKKFYGSIPTGQSMGPSSSFYSVSYKETVNVEYLTPIEVTLHIDNRSNPHVVYS